MNEAIYTSGELVLAAEGDNVVLPAEIMVMQENKWQNAPNRPDLEITASDIDEYADNYHHLKIQPDVPIDIEHGEDPTFGKRAAGWVKDVYAKTLDTGKRALFVKPDWNKLGTQLVSDKQFKHVSAEFYPRALGGKADPEGKGKLSNVLRALTITNRPWMKDLPALMASETAGENISALTYQIDSSTINSNEGATPVNLDQIRGKNPTELSADEKTFLGEHKADLSAAEQAKFGLAEPAPDPAPTKATEDTVTIKASEYEDLKKGAAKGASLEARISTLETQAAQGVKASEQLARATAKAVVDKHIARGAVKQDQSENWVNQLVKAGEDTDERKTLESMLDGIPENPAVKGTELGDGSPNAGGGASKQIIDKTNEVVKASEGGKLKWTDALMQVRAENPQLAKEADAEAANGEVN